MSRAAVHPGGQRKRRHPPSGGYARGDETRSKIVAAALDVFGDHGYDGASTRMLADQAGVNLPALQYYFDGKEGVYLACAEHIAERLEARLGPAADYVMQVLAREEPSREQLFHMLHEFLDRFADFFLGGHELEKWVLFIVREQAQPTGAFDILFDRVMNPVLGACGALVGRLLVLPGDDPVVRVRAFALLGQIIFFRTAREAALRMMGWPDFEGDRVTIVKDTLLAQIEAALGGAGTAMARSNS
ncbi:MAG: CerR family C-terminal domain-containing protein [Beijerinckiaceae bacterium]|jgi:AcrR family transcriptional regulator